MIVDENLKFLRQIEQQNEDWFKKELAKILADEERKVHADYYVKTAPTNPQPKLRLIRGGKS